MGLSIAIYLGYVDVQKLFVGPERTLLDNRSIFLLESR